MISTTIFFMSIGSAFVIGGIVHSWVINKTKIGKSAITGFITNTTNLVAEDKQKLLSELQELTK
jgi:hypothetical protein